MTFSPNVNIIQWNIEGTEFHANYRSISKMRLLTTLFTCNYNQTSYLFMKHLKIAKIRLEIEKFRQTSRSIMIEFFDMKWSSILEKKEGDFKVCIKLAYTIENRNQKRYTSILNGSEQNK